MADTKTSIIISAEDRTRQAFESATNGLKGLESAAARLPMLGAALATAFSGATFTAAINDAIKFTASLDDMAEKTGASVETLSGLARVAQIGGHDLGVVEQATIKLAKGLAEADNKSSGASRALKALGLSAEQLRGMDTGQALKVIADRLNEFKDGAGKSALAMDLLGKSGAQALPYLKDLAEQGALVATTTTEQAAAAEKYEKNINRLKVEMDGLARTVANDVVPSLNKMFEVINRPGAGFAGAASTGLDRALFGGDYVTRIRELQDDLEGLENAKAAPGSMLGGGWFGTVADAKIAQLKSTIEGLKALQAADALQNNAASYSNEGRAAGISSLTGYVSTDEKDPKKPKKPEIDNDTLGRLLRQEDEKAAEALERQRQAYIAMADPLQKYRLQLDEINKLRADGTLTADQAIEAEWAVNDAMDSVKDKMLEVGKTGEEVSKDLIQAFDGFGKQISGDIADAVIEGEADLERLGKSFLKEMLTMAIYKNAMQPIMSGVSTWASGLFTPSANGNVYASASLSQYSNGVYDSPKVFGFANGVGVFGEAGPEAIMPLKRGPDGKLGVSGGGGGGGGGVVVNVIEDSSRGGERHTSQGSGGETIVDVFVAKVKASLAKDISTGSGVAPVFENTYGLNRAAGAWG